MRAALVRVAAVFLAVCALTACEYMRNQEALYVNTAQVWPNHTISVCWETPGYHEEKIAVRDAVKASWEANSSVVFSGWGLCTSAPTNIRIVVSDTRPMSLLGAAINNHPGGMVLNFMFGGWDPGCAETATRTSCIRSIAVHEFGHALGFGHEQDRPDTDRTTCAAEFYEGNGTETVGLWDMSSVMNYCNPNWNNGGVLSATDIVGVQQFYGAPPANYHGAAPAGSYTQTCSNFDWTMDMLFATCADAAGGTVRTGLTIARCAGTDIANLYGILSCAPLNAAPAGVYTQSCDTIVAGDGVMSALCRKSNGAAVRTHLFDFDRCTTDIFNFEGELRCGREGATDGSYLISCRDATAFQGTLYATCNRAQHLFNLPDWTATTLFGFAACQGDIANSDGQFRCANGVAPPSGSYQLSCTDIFADTRNLMARCDTGQNGGWRRTIMHDYQACAGDRANSGGNIVCS